MLRPSSFPPYSQSCSLANILIPLEQIPRVDLIGHVGQVVAPAVGDDHVAAGLEGRKVVRHLAAEELGRAQSGLVGHHRDALGLDALRDALNRRGAEVVGVRLHGQAVHAHHRLGPALVHQRHHAVDHLVGDKVLADAVGLHDGLDEVLRYVAVVGQQLLGVLGQAVAAVSEGGVVVVEPDARLQAHALDDVGGREPSRLAVGVQLIEVGRYLPPAYRPALRRIYAIRRYFHCRTSLQHRLARNSKTK